VTSHEDLGIVLIQGTLVVTNSWHVLDDDRVVRVFALLVEHRVGFNHVIDDIGLGNLLRAELLLGAEILSVIVAKVVVAGNGGELDTSADQEVHEGRLHLGLTRFEVVTANEGIVLLRKVNASWDEGVLGRTVDERNALKDGCDSKDGRWSNLLVALLNGLHEVLRGVIDAGQDLSEAFSVSSPLNDNLLQSILGLEVAKRILVMVDFQFGFYSPDVLANLLNMSEAGLTTLEAVVGTVLLVGSNEVRVVDAGKWNHLSHLLLDLSLESWLENSSSVHGPGQVHAADVPASDDKVIGMNHGQDIMEGNVDILGSLCIGAELHGRTHDDRAIVVSSTRTFTGVPDEATAIGNDTSSNSGTVVAAPSD
jgi:hypothetical protein